MKKIKIKNHKNFKEFYSNLLSNKYKKILKKKYNIKRNKKTNNIFTIIYITIIIFIISFISYKLSKKYFFKKYKTPEKVSEEIKQKSEMVNNPVEIMNKYKRKNITWPIFEKLIFKPHMSDIDLQALSYFMNPKNIYFEFGSGGSTNLASYYNLSTIYSVESDAKWHEKLKKNGIKANYITVDLKSKGDWGNPGEGTTVVDWKKYIQSYQSEYNADIIFIDGRFRVACAFDVFQKIRNDTIIVIHDYNSVNDYYVIEDFYVKIQTWDLLACFIKKANISSIPDDIYNKYLYIKK